jgi:hypothetical protein
VKRWVMEILEEIANELRVNKDVLAKDSLKLFLQRELLDVEAQMFKITHRHGIKSVFEFDEQLKAGKVREEDIMDDFMELDHLEVRRDEVLRAMKKI